jgi:DNA polymerase-3 subunit delta'
MFCRERQPDTIDACGECRACRGFQAGTWPDYIELGVPAGKTTIPIELIAGADDRRGREGLCFELSMSPQASDRRIAIINDAQRMNAEGANALLKTLEEPPAQALMILICDNPDSLLPTIRSRCQVIRFFPLADAEIRDILLAEEYLDSPAEAEKVAAMSEGSVTLAQQLLNPDLRHLRGLITQQLEQLDQMKPVEISRQVADELERISSGTEEQRRNGQWLLRFIAETLNGRLRRLTGGDFTDPLLQRFGVRNGVDMLSPLLDRVITASHQIDGNSPVRLVLEALFDDLARQLRLGPISAR